MNPKIFTYATAIGAITAVPITSMAGLGDPVAIGSALPTITVPHVAPNFRVSDLASNFELESVTQDLVKFDTRYGDIYIEMLPGVAPLTVANFYAYMDRGDFDDMVFHRSLPGFVVQGGNLKLPWPSGGSPSVIATDPPVLNEFGISNTRGTLAMAKQESLPNSATSQFFFNVGDNSANLDNQNGGFTVFARVIGSGMQVVDTMNALPTDPNDFPFDGWDGVAPFEGTFAVTTNTTALAAKVSTGNAYATITASSSDPTIATVTTAADEAIIVPQSIGNATITITATDPYGVATASKSFLFRSEAVIPFDADHPRYDFSGNRNPDMVWFNPVTAAFWTQKISNAEVVGGRVLYTSVGAPWEVYSDDFNGDEHPDFLWRNPVTGVTWIQYLVNGYSVGGRALTHGIAAPWQLDVEDFNADGQPDLLWRNPNTGVHWLRYLDADGNVIGGKVLSVTTGNPWDMHVADFNRDSHPDLLWRNPVTGSTWVQYLVNGNPVGGKALSVNVAAPWRAMVADHNDDGNPDILWRNPNTGVHWFQYLNNGDPVGGKVSSTITVGNPWKLLGEE